MGKTMGKTVFLPLKKEWYEMIESGVKLHEYRSITPYWCQRFLLDGNGNKRSKDYWAGFLSKYCFTPYEYRLSLLIGWIKKGLCVVSERDRGCVLLWVYTTQNDFQGYGDLFRNWIPIMGGRSWRAVFCN